MGIPLTKMYPSGVVNSEPGMAHFAGSGPEPFLCLECDFFRLNASKRPIRVYAKRKDLLPRAPEIKLSGNSSCCRYFDKAHR